MAKNTPKKKTKKKKSRKLLWIILSIFVVFLAGASVGGYYLYEDISAGIPSLEELENPQAQLASRVYSADGELIARYYLQNRVETSLDSIPKHLVNALIATEDLKYYDHWGVNVERIIKALTKYFILGGKRQGGSTITQQLAKNLYKLKKDKESGYDTVVRKLTEFVTAVQLEKAYTKNEILEMYLNTNYLGQGTYGVDMAAKAY
ncbi:MAG: transglycosylase domain-containing protein, partial [Rhodothermaceae bacterium]